MIEKVNLPLQRLGVRILCAMFVGLALLFAAELALDLSLTGARWEDLHATSHAGQSLASCVSRAMNNLTAMVLTFIALAVPLTANMYTPKLIEIFVRDRVNIAAMCFYAAMGAHALFGQAAMYDQWAPAVVYHTLWIGGVVGFAVLIPYYFYVLSFLNPVAIIERVRELIFLEFEDVREGVRPAPEARRRLNQEVLNLGNVILRAIDRTDRDVSLDAISALQRTVMRYGEFSHELPDAWFEVERELFPGHSRAAIDYIVRDRVWVEQKCLHQLLLAYSASLAKMPDAISAISSVNRRIALHAKQKGNDPLLGLCARYFNTFVREAVKKKDVHAIYDVFSQYQSLAKELLLDRPELALAVGRHFKYYAEFARWQGMQFIYELGAHDLATLGQDAYEAKAPCRKALLELFLTFSGDNTSVRLTKAQVLMAAWFRSKRLADEASQVADAIQRSSEMQLDVARRELLAVDDPVFWEVTDRQRNLDYVDPELRQVVQQVLDESIARKRGGPGSV